MVVVEHVEKKQWQNRVNFFKVVVAVGVGERGYLTVTKEDREGEVRGESERVSDC